MPHGAETDQVFPHRYRYEEGAFHPGDAPGLGVEIDEALAARYPYARAYLPVNRKAGRHAPRLVSVTGQNHWSLAAAAAKP